MNVIEEHIEKVLEVYTRDDYYKSLLDAKEEYFQLTGKLNEDAPDFESRMSSFNDWYVFNYHREDDRRIIDDYVQDNSLSEDLAQSFYNVNYSLFHFVKYDWKKRAVIKDILHSKKLVVERTGMTSALVPDDLFISRSIEYQGKVFFMRGICILPRDVLGILKKESKKIRKLNNNVEELKFLLQCEKLKTKSMNYSHIAAEKIFSFN